jgi:hypothetical protein
MTQERGQTEEIRIYVGFPEGDDKLPILKRDYLVDVDMETVNIICRFGRPPGMKEKNFAPVYGRLP